MESYHGGVAELAIMLLIIGAIALVAAPWIMRKRGVGNDWVPGTLLVTGVSPRPGDLTGEQYAAALGDALGEEVLYRPLGWDEFRAQGFPGAVEMGNMFQYYAQNSARFVGDRDLSAVRALNPGLLSFRDWLALPDNGIRTQ